MSDFRKDDVVITYDPNYVDEHTDSSDFEERLAPPIRIYKKHNPFVRKTKAEKEYPDTTMQNPYQNCVENVKTTLYCHHCGTAVPEDTKIPSSLTPRYGSNLGCERGSKSNLLKKKLSSIFSRSNRKVMPAFEENTGNAKNNWQVYCVDCRRRQIRKFNRKQQARSVYLAEDMPQGPLGSSNNEPEPFRKWVMNHVLNPGSFTSSSEVEIKEIKLNRRTQDDELDKEIKKEFLKYKERTEKQFKHRSQQYCKCDKYHVFMNQCCQNRDSTSTRASTSTSACCGELPLSASGFWEYFFNKLNAKYQALANSEICYPDNCGATSPMQGNKFKQKQGIQNQTASADQLDYTNKLSCKCDAQTSTSSRKVSQQPLFEKESNMSRVKKSSSPIFKEANAPPGSKKAKSKLWSKKSDSKIPSDKSTSPRVSEKSSSLNVECQCDTDTVCSRHKERKLSPRERKLNQNERNVSQKEHEAGYVGTNGKKSCQESHDQVTKTLQQKYNGEILCIHSPPCVLINGCLNLPRQSIKSQPVDIWPVTVPEKKLGYLSRRKKTKKGKNKLAVHEQACQYHPPLAEIQNFVMEKSEKLIQSICHHDPPCKLVPACFKMHYNPTLVDTCIHVPICNNVPECLEVGENTSIFSCDHTTRCNKMPECTRNFVGLTSREDVSTQVRPKIGLMCRHEPACTVIPRCLGRLMGDSVTLGCVHQPPCEMIPACFRNYEKETLSVGSQYSSAACRIV